MSQIVTINGRPMDLDWEPSLKVGTPPLWRPPGPSVINSRMVHGVTINGYDYPPCLSGAQIYLPGLPGQGSLIWDRSNAGKDGTITGATWRRLPSGVLYLYFDALDDEIDYGDDSDFEYEDFTDIAWFRSDDAAQGTALLLCRQFQRQGATGQAGAAILINSGANLVASFVTVGTNDQDTLTGAQVLGTTEWWQLLHTKIGTARVLYLNGVNVASDTLSSATMDYTSTSLNTLIGRGDDNGVYARFKGCIAFEESLDRGLSAEDVANLWQQDRHLFGR